MPKFKLLVALMDSTDADAVKDLSVCIKRGDVVDCRLANRPWGRDESKIEWVKFWGDDTQWPGRYTLVEVELSNAQAAELIMPLLEPATVLDDEYSAPDPEDRFVVRRARKWRFSEDNIAALTVASAVNSGLHITTIDKLRPALRHVVTNVEFNI